MFGAFPQWGVSSVGLAQHLVTSSMESLGGRSLGEHISFYLSKDEGPCRKAGGRRKDLLDSDRRTLQPPRGAAWEPGHLLVIRASAETLTCFGRAEMWVRLPAVLVRGLAAALPIFSSLRSRTFNQIKQTRLS